MTRVSVVVVNWNAGPALDECLASVFGSQGCGDGPEVVLVDNGSTDGSQGRATRRHPAPALVQNRDNVGFARAANQGLRVASGDLTLLLNPDVVLAPRAIALLAAFLDARPAAAAVGPRLLDPSGTVQGSARRDPSPWTGLFGRSAPLTRLFPGNPWSRWELPGLAHDGDGPLEVDWVSGACLMVRRAAYERVGLLDERFFLFWEDADWCRRFRQAGWSVYYYPLAAAMHRVGVSRARRAVRSTLDFHRSAYRYYRKHYLAARYHPLVIPLVAGLLLSLGLRLPGALWRRGG